MSGWDPAAFNWRRVLASPTFNLHPLFILALGLGLGAALPVASWIGLVLFGFLAFVVAVEYAWILGSSIRRERKRLIVYRESVGHRSTEG